MIEQLFLRHPRSLGETYAEHLMIALGIAWTLLVAGAACFVHGLAPALFETTASRTIRRLNQGLDGRRSPATQGVAAERLEYQI